MPKHFAASSSISIPCLANPKILKALDNEVILVDDMRLADFDISNSRINYNIICYCQNGQFEVEFAGDRHIQVHKQQMLLIPTGRQLKGFDDLADNTKVLFILLTDSVLRTVLAQQIDIWNKAIYLKNTYVLDNANWFLNIKDCTLSIFKNLSKTIQREISFSILRTILLLICDELMCQEDLELNDDLSTPHEKSLFNQFLTLLRQQEVKRRNVSFYANLMNITPKYLSSISRKVSGKSPMRWITENVMQDCYSMLYETNLSMKEIADRLGFPNASCFGQFFKEQSGMTPGEFRNKNNTLVK